MKKVGIVLALVLLAALARGILHWLVFGEGVFASFLETPEDIARLVAKIILDLVVGAIVVLFALPAVLLSRRRMPVVASMGTAALVPCLLLFGLEFFTANGLPEAAIRLLGILFVQGLVVAAVALKYWPAKNKDAVQNIFE
ncbi:hypothetical protein ACFO5Q_08635 [Kordiimonas lipolytica]|uniref:Uncharacterized protein n=1 Tax=Kordiimonas lipolytica TaxID=1662421 RepID=A0ABV8UAH3_9PROT|nr:hypothetical protein [Kordiimonas lipolytica]